MATSIMNPVHLALLVLVVLLLFGAKRLPELGQSLGTSLRAFKDSVDGGAESRSSQLPAPANESSVVSREVEQPPQAAVGP